MPSAGTLWVNIAANTEQLTKGLQKAERDLNQFAKPLLKMGLIITGPIAAATKVFVDITKNAEKLAKVSTKDAEAAQKLASGIEAFRGKMEQAAIQVGSAVAGPLTGLLDLIGKLADMFSRWAADNKGLVALIGALGLALLAVGAAAKTAAIAVGVLRSTIVAVRTAVLLLTAHPLVLLATAIAGIGLVVAKQMGWLEKFAQKLGLVGDRANSTAGAIGNLNSKDPGAEVIQKETARQARVKERRLFELPGWVNQSRLQMLKVQGQLGANSIGRSIGKLLGQAMSFDAQRGPQAPPPPPKSMGLTPALNLTRSGSAESFRQRAAIRRQDDAMKVQKTHLGEAKKQTTLLQRIEQAVGLRPANI